MIVNIHFISKYFLTNSYEFKLHFVQKCLCNKIFVINSKQDMQSEEQQIMEASNFQKIQPVDFTLSYEQYIVIQHFLPKRYALIQHKHIRKGMVITSAAKLPHDQTQNLSRLSGNVDNTQQIQGRNKRNRTKKVDKFLQEQQTKTRKPTVNEAVIEDDFAQCHFILGQLKKHRSSYPFLIPVDPKRDGVLNYFDIIKQPMDLQTIENNLKNEVYTTTSQFHAHVNKIWANSYTFNERGSLVHRLAGDMERYYKSLLNNDSYKKGSKTQKTKVRPDKQKKSEYFQQRDERKKPQFFGNKDFIYEDLQ